MIETDPRADEALFGHRVHALAPTTPEYVPTGHKAHTLTLVAPATPEYAPAAQLSHTVAFVAPVTFEYVPAEQFVQNVVPNWPGGHTTAGHVYVSS